jgi:hypothetical protein
MFADRVKTGEIQGLTRHRPAARSVLPHYQAVPFGSLPMRTAPRFVQCRGSNLQMGRFPPFEAAQAPA